LVFEYFVNTFVSTEAIHNKDFSVVKTFKSPSSYNTGAFYLHYFAEFAETPNLKTINKKSNPPGLLFLIDL